MVKEIDTNYSKQYIIGNTMMTALQASAIHNQDAIVN